MLYHTKIPLKFLAEAINRALCLHNPSPTSALEDKTPFDSWFEEKPNTSNLKVFKSVCFVRTPDHLRMKLDQNVARLQGVWISEIKFWSSHFRAAWARKTWTGTKTLNSDSSNGRALPRQHRGQGSNSRSGLNFSGLSLFYLSRQRPN